MKASSIQLIYQKRPYWQDYSWRELIKYSKIWKVDELFFLGFHELGQSENDQLYENDYIKSFYFDLPARNGFVDSLVNIVKNMKSLRYLKLFPGEQNISLTDVKKIFEALKFNNSISDFVLYGDVDIKANQLGGGDDLEDDLTEDDLILCFKELIRENKVLETIEFCFDLNIAKNIPNQISLDEALELNCFLTSIQFKQNKLSSEDNQFLKRNLLFFNHLARN